MLCPGCSQPIMFKDIKAHINQQHSGLWKQENQRTKIDEKAYGGHAVKNQGPPANTVYPSGGAEDKPKAAKNFGSSYKAYSGNQQPVAEQRPRQQRFEECPPISKGYRQSNQHHEVERDFSGQRTNKHDDSANQKNYARDEFSKSPGMSFVTPVHIKEQSHVPLQAGYRGDAGTAGLGGYPETDKVDDLQRDSPVQHSPRLDESAALSVPAVEDMDVTVSCLQSPTGAPISDAEQRMADASGTSACRYCCTRFHVEHLEEHLDMCPTLFTIGNDFFSSEIFKNYEIHVSVVTQGSKQSRKSLGDHMKDGLLSSPVYKTLLKYLMFECYEEHLSRHCHGEPDVLAKIKEHIPTCPTFTSRCGQFWTQVMLGYGDPLQNILCPTNDQGGQSFQKKEVGDCFKSSGGDEHRERKESSPPTEGCPYCSEKWEMEEFADHLTSCDKQFINCHQCATKVHKDNFQQHLKEKCLAKEHVGNYVEKAQEGNIRGARKEGDIEDLKKKVEDLEKRIKALEDPLKRLIERLKEDERKKNGE
ncbi:uncharacterized protein LOC144142286 isoform X2 [Haemaphysalis longicornis]